MPAASGTFDVSCPEVGLKTSKLGCCRAGEGRWDSSEGGCALCHYVTVFDKGEVRYA